MDKSQKDQEELDTSPFKSPPTKTAKIEGQQNTDSIASTTISDPSTSISISSEDYIASPTKKKARMESTTAIGVCKFKELVEKSTIFIDKSLLIKDFLESAANVLLITCPRRWGKSINMDMIKTFLEIEMDKDGNKYQDKSNTSNYKLFKKGEIDFGNSKTVYLEEPLHIAQHLEIINAHQGQYPVIFVDFKNIKGTNYTDILDGVKTSLHEAFKQHEWLYKFLLKKVIDDYNEIFGTSINTQGKDVNFLERVVDVKKIQLSGNILRFKNIYKNAGQNATDIEIKHSLEFLSKLLHNYFGKKVYVLMDEYDTPINNILQSDKFSNEDLEETLMLFRVMMGTTFKGNRHLEKGLITGVFRIAKSFFFSDLNNITEYNFLNNKFARHYGFNQEEIKYLFKEYKISPTLAQQGQDWYDGYMVSVDPDLRIYNPWSIVNFLDSKMIKNYWVESGNIDFIKNLFKINEIQSIAQSLINKENVLVNLHGLKFSKEDFLTLKELLNKGDNYKINEEATDLFFSYIFAAGYLTISEEQKYDTITAVKLPNKEVTSEFENKLISYYEQVYNIDIQLFAQVTVKLAVLFKEEDTNEFKKSLEELFKAFPDFVDIKRDIGGVDVHGNEDLIYSVLNYISLQLKSLSKFGSEVWMQKKRGRADIVLVNDNVQLGMIIELKYAGSVEEAFKQDTKYKSIFENYTNIKKIKHVGINVLSDKTVDITAKLEDNPSYNPSGTGTDEENSLC